VGYSKHNITSGQLETLPIGKIFIKQERWQKWLPWLLKFPEIQKRNWMILEDAMFASDV